MDGVVVLLSLVLMRLVSTVVRHVSDNVSPSIGPTDLVCYERPITPSASSSQVQFRNKLSLRAGPSQTHNGVVRTAHLNGSYLVGFQDGTTR